MDGTDEFLDDVQVRQLFPVAATIDWSAGRSRTVELLVGEHGWSRSGRRVLQLPGGLAGGVLGSTSSTRGLMVWHTAWTPGRADQQHLAFERMQHLKQVIEQVIGDEPSIGRGDTGEAYVWDRADGSRVWLDGEAIRFVSPQTADVQRRIGTGLDDDGAEGHGGG